MVVTCYDCGHRVHGCQQCVECSCPDRRADQRLDAKLRERPHQHTDDPT